MAAVAAGSMREEHVLGLLAMNQSVDSAIGSIGAANASTRDVKDFGIMMSREHMALRREVLNMARDLNLEPATPLTALDAASPELRAMLDSADAGAAWDRSYLAYAVAAHEASLENMARALAATKSPEIKSYIERSAPIIQKHLEKAKRLQGTGTATKAPNGR